MEPGTTEMAEVTYHQLRSKIKEVAGIIIDCPNLQAEGTGGKTAGTARVKIGQYNKHFGK